MRVFDFAINWLSRILWTARTRLTLRNSELTAAAPHNVQLWSDPDIFIYRVRPGFSSATAFSALRALDSIGDQYQVLVLDLSEVASCPDLDPQLIEGAIRASRAIGIPAFVAGASSSFQRRLAIGAGTSVSFVDQLDEAVVMARVEVLKQRAML